MKTQIHIRNTKKWAILFIVLMALSASLNAQPVVKGGYDKEVVSVVENAWNSLEQLADNTEKNLSYKAASFLEGPEEAIAEESADLRNSSLTVLLVENSQERKDELKSNPKYGKDVMQVEYFQQSTNTTWYKIRNIFTKKPSLDCNLCTRVVSTPYVVYLVKK